MIHIQSRTSLSNFKKMQFAAKQIDLENVILSEISQTEKNKYLMTSLICGIQKEMNTDKTERDSQIYRTNLWSQGAQDSQEGWDAHVHTAIFKVDNQQGPIVQHNGNSI